jgi:hypothetical protein
MMKYTCKIKRTITHTYEVEDDIEIDSPDEVQAEEDAIAAGQNMVIHTSSLQRIDTASELVEVDIDIEVEVLDMEEMNG